MTDEKRFEDACDLVQQINLLSKSGDAFSMIGVPKHLAGKQCPLCLVKNTCLGPSCLGLSGILALPFKAKQTFKITESKETDHQLITRQGTSCQILGFQDLHLLKSQTQHLIGTSVEIIILTLNEFVEVSKVS